MSDAIERDLLLIEETVGRIRKALSPPGPAPRAALYPSDARYDLDFAREVVRDCRGPGLG